MNKIGIITFHNSYNCGSMLESYAIQEVIKRYCSENVEIINFSNKSQEELYSVWFKNNSIKNVIKNILLFCSYKKIEFNNNMYLKFKNENFILSCHISKMEELTDDGYSVVVSGSDQVWNITIEDGDDAYFLPWVQNAKKIAYAPSFGAKKIEDYTTDIKKYKDYLNAYDALSIRENNGQKWIQEMVGKDVPVLVDPTLILNIYDYEKLIAHNIDEKDHYIFFYCPSFNIAICKFVKKIAEKYDIKVITWSAKSYIIKRVNRFGFQLAEYENPSSYLYYIKNADLIITTSFHGTIFSTIFRKNFITVKNGEMYGTDDRVITLLKQIGMMDCLIPFDFNENCDYMRAVDYTNYNNKILELQQKSIEFLIKNIGDQNEKN